MSELESRLNYELKGRFPLEQVAPLCSAALMAREHRETLEVLDATLTEQTLNARVEIAERKLAPGEEYFVTIFNGCEIVKILGRRFVSLFLGQAIQPGALYLKDFEINCQDVIRNGRFGVKMSLEKREGSLWTFQFSLGENAFTGRAFFELLDYAPAGASAKSDDNYLTDKFEFAHVDMAGKNISLDARTVSEEAYKDGVCLNKSLLLEMLGQLGMIHAHLLLGLDRKSALVWAGKTKIESREPIVDPSNIKLEARLLKARTMEYNPRILVVDYETLVNGGAIKVRGRLFFDPPRLKPDWQKERAHFPMQENRTYFMNAAITPFRDEVGESIRQEVENMTKLGGMRDKRFYINLEVTRSGIGEILGTKSKNVALLPNTSIGVGVFASTLPQLTNKKEILIPQDEFTASLLPWTYNGFRATLLPSTRGALSWRTILDKVTDDTAAVMTSAVQFGTGYRQDLQSLGAALHERGIPLFVNATQAFGAFPIQFDKWKITGLVSSGHKWLGAGLGLSIFAASENYWSRVRWPWVGWRSLENPWEFSLEQEPVYRKEPATLEAGSYSSVAGMGLYAAVQNVLRLGTDHISARILELVVHLRARLEKEGFALALEAPVENLSGIVAVSVDDPNRALCDLAEHRIYITIRNSQLRIAVHYYNSIEEIDRLVDVLVAARNKSA